eukprot:728418-Rhodomonas_salina.1
MMSLGRVAPSSPDIPSIAKNRLHRFHSAGYCVPPAPLRQYRTLRSVRVADTLGQYQRLCRDSVGARSVPEMW